MRTATCISKHSGLRGIGACLVLSGLILALAHGQPVAAIEAAARTATDSDVSSQLPREFAGIFSWDDENAAPWGVRLSLESAGPQPGGTLALVGTLTYLPKGTSVTVSGSVQLSDRRLELVEGHSEAAGFVGGGGFEGIFSPDFRLMVAIWSSPDSEKEGVLILQHEEGLTEAMALDPIYAACAAMSIQRAEAEGLVGEEAQMAADLLCRMVARQCFEDVASKECVAAIREYAAEDGAAGMLFQAVFAGRGDVVEQLMALGYPPEVAEEDDRGESWTPLMLAAAEGHQDIVSTLLAAGANAHTRNGLGRTALMFAAFRGYAGIVEDLLRAGADPNVVPDDGTGHTALMAAAGVGHAEVVKLLLANGADKTQRDAEGMTALELAKDRGHDDVAQLLRE